MALVVDSTVGGASANSYVSVAEADAYHDSRVTYATWAAASADSKARAVVSATRMLDDYICWKGNKAALTQALRWPRYSMFDRDGDSIDSNVVPTDLKYATAELAAALLTSDREKDADTRGISNLGVGPISITFDRTDRTPPIPDHVFAMLAHYGPRQRFDGTGRVLKLARS
jgi:hypothetical protein